MMLSSTQRLAIDTVRLSLSNLKRFIHLMDAQSVVTRESEWGRKTIINSLPIIISSAETMANSFQSRFHSSPIIQFPYQKTSQQIVWCLDSRSSPRCQWTWRTVAGRSVGRYSMTNFDPLWLPLVVECGKKSHRPPPSTFHLPCATVFHFFFPSFRQPMDKKAKTKNHNSSFSIGSRSTNC